MFQNNRNQLSRHGDNHSRRYIKIIIIPSRNLQLSVGYLKKSFETFKNSISDGKIMYKSSISNKLTIIPATENEAHFVEILYAQNQEALHTGNISLDKWKELLSAQDEDERHFLVWMGNVPIAYMKINRLENTDKAWISMLFVSKNFQRKGIGSFAIKYAEEYVKSKGLTIIAVQTDKDNLPAQNCYLKCGFQVFEKDEKIKFYKTLQ